MVDANPHCSTCTVQNLVLFSSDYIPVVPISNLSFKIARIFSTFTMFLAILPRVLSASHLPPYRQKQYTMSILPPQNLSSFVGEMDIQVHLTHSCATNEFCTNTNNIIDK